MNTQIKEKKRRRDRLKNRDDARRIKTIREAKARFDARKFKVGVPAPSFSPEEATAKINEIEAWLEELKNLEVKENTNLDREETVLLLRSMFKELIKGEVTDETIRILNHKIHKVIQQKRGEITKFQKRNRKKQKQLNREIDLKHYEGSTAEKLLDLVSQRKVENVEQVKTLLDRIWRKVVNGDVTAEKDFEAIEAGKEFIRWVDSLTS